MNSPRTRRRNCYHCCGTRSFAWAIKQVGELGLSEIALALHGSVMPILFYAMLVLFIGAVLKRHFGEHHKQAVQCMLSCCESEALPR